MKIETKDLRIGNILKDSSGATCKVIEIFENSYKARRIDKEKTVLPIVPIQMTEEILIEFGFKTNLGNVYTLYIEDEFFLYYSLISEKGGLATLEYDHYNGTNEEIVIIDDWLQYVHEFQNVYYALTKLEL